MNSRRTVRPTDALAALALLAVAAAALFVFGYLAGVQIGGAP